MRVAESWELVWGSQVVMGPEVAAEQEVVVKQGVVVKQEVVGEGAGWCRVFSIVALGRGIRFAS